MLSLKQAWIVLLLSIIATVCIYHPGGLYFLNDDMLHIPQVAKGIIWQHHALRPVHDLLLQMDTRLWNHDPFGYHLTALLLHLVCAGLLFPFIVLLLSRYATMEKEKIQVVALMSTALFLVYAFHSEAVLWILGRTASLCVLFFLLSGIAYFYKEKGIHYFILSLICFYISLYTYEAVWVAPFFVGLLYIADVYYLHKPWKKELVWPLVYCMAFIVQLFLRVQAMGELGGTYGNERLFNFNISMLFLNYNRLLARSFLPPMKSVMVFVACFGVVVIVLFILLRRFVKLKRVDPVFLLLSAGYLLSLLPVITLGIDTHDTESERYLYLPSVFLCTWIVYVLVRFSLRRAYVMGIFLLLLGYNFFFTFSNCRDYRVASSMAAVVYQQVGAKAAKNGSTRLIHLPYQFKGVPMFRLGFKEGLYWLGQTDTGKITVRDTTEVFPGPAYNREIWKSHFYSSINEMQTGNGNTQLEFRPDTTYFSFAE